VHDWIRPEALARAEAPLRPFAPDFLDRAEGADSIGAMFARGGYRCGMVGKWHVGSSDRAAPGYEYWWAHQLGGGPYHEAPIWEHDPKTGRPMDPPRAATEPEYLTDAITRQGLDFLARTAEEPDRPFFLQVNWTAPHDPWFDGNHPQDLLDLYADTDFPSVPQPPHHPWFTAEGWPRATTDRHGALAGYCAAISGVDRSIAALLEDLEKRGLLEDTIVVFTADNGFSCGHHGIWGKGNGSFPLNFWEPSITVPFIVRWPGHVPAGMVQDRPASAVDLLPTLAELTGNDLRPDPLRAGRSLAVRLLGGQEADGADAGPVVIHDEYGANRMMRAEGWKLVLRREGPTELYDLRADPLEEHDLSGDPDSTGRILALTSLLEDWFAQHTSPPLSGWGVQVDGSGQTGPIA
jgi:arylsulfatase A-like enzyme